MGEKKGLRRFKRLVVVESYSLRPEKHSKEGRLGVQKTTLHKCGPAHTHMRTEKDALRMCAKKGKRVKQSIRNRQAANARTAQK